MTYTYPELVKYIEELKAEIAKDQKWLTKLYSKKVIQHTQFTIEMNTKLLETAEANLPKIKEEWKKAEIARLTAELEKIKAL